MAPLLKIAIWNANGLCQHAPEVKLFIQDANIDILLISETHFTNRSFFKIPNYNVYNTNHPDNTGHGGTAIIIKRTIKHHERAEYKIPNIQATSVCIEDATGEITLSAIYCPPRHKNKQADFTTFFKTLGTRFIVGGDYNAKHTTWGSRITTTKGRELLLSMQKNNLNYLTTRQPTYWPSDRNRLPDLLDFCVVKGMDPKKLLIESCLELNSDHTPIIVSTSNSVICKPKKPSLYSRKTDWNLFRKNLDQLLNLEIPLKTILDLENAVENLTKAIQQAAWQSTPDAEELHIIEKCPIVLKEKLIEKRKARKKWQLTKAPSDKQKYNKLAKELKKLLLKARNESIQDYLKELTPTEATDYSLWKATRKLKHPQLQIPPIRKQDNTWARTDQQKVTTFADHLTKVFQPNPSQSPTTEADTAKFLNIPHQMSLPIKNTNQREVEKIISELNIKKAPGFDLITGKVLRELPENGYKILTYIFNAALRIEHFPCQWKVAEIVMIPKPGKNPNEVSSYRPISLLPTLSKVLEKIILNRITPLIDEQQLIPNHQFGFRKKHGTLEQIHRLVHQINRVFETKQYCSAVCIDISQAFDKVWITGLLYKLKRSFPHPIYALLRSYLTNRTFRTKYQEAHSNILPILSGVPQGSLLGPILYSLYTADLPETPQTIIATYADDTTILASHEDPITASQNLQTHLTHLEEWLQRWRIKANETKSTHITFTLKRGNCPGVTLNGTLIPHTDNIKYLGLHLDRRLTWRTHIFNKRKLLGKKFSQMYWLLGRNSALTTDNKLLLYKTILQPIWKYGIPLWGTASKSNLEIIQRFQNKVLRAIVNAPWYVSNAIIHTDLSISTVRQEISTISDKHVNKMITHPNQLANTLFDDEEERRRLKRFKPTDLPTRFV